MWIEIGGVFMYVMFSAWYCRVSFAFTWFVFSQATAGSVNVNVVPALYVCDALGVRILMLPLISESNVSGTVHMSVAQLFVM